MCSTTKLGTKENLEFLTLNSIQKPPRRRRPIRKNATAVVDNHLAVSKKPFNNTGLFLKTNLVSRCFLFCSACNNRLVHIDRIERSNKKL